MRFWTPNSLALSEGHWRAITATIATVLLLCSCREPTSQTAVLSGSVTPEAVGISARLRATEPEQFRVADQVPTFGGFWFDAQGNLHAYLGDLAQSDRLRVALQEVFVGYRPSARQPAVVRRSIVIHKGAHQFTDLSRWKLTVSKAATHIADFQRISVRKHINRVSVGVVSEAAAAELRTIINASGIPLAAVTVEVEQPIVSLARLSDAVSPRIGGLAIETLNGANSLIHFCSIGVNANNGTAFLTASHCTAVRGPDPPIYLTYAYQPKITTGPEIGFETNDPAYFGSLTDECCPTNQPRCRYTDAALFAYHSAVAPNRPGQGYIAKTTFSRTGYGVFGSDTISGNIEIVGDYNEHTYYSTIDKIGRASGWTFGSIIDTCDDIRPGGATYWYLCQVAVDDAAASAGDSGGPVFLWLGGNRASLAGIVIAGNLGRFWYSKINKIRDEIGNFVTTR